MDGFELLGQHAVAHTQYPGGPVYLEGEVIAYADHPIVVIRTADGQQRHWAAHLCTFRPRESAAELLARLLAEEPRK